MIYLNARLNGTRETVDEFEPEPGQSRKDFRKYVRDMIAEYHAAGIPVYQSTRACANWKG